MQLAAQPTINTLSATPNENTESRIYRLRWWTLAVLSLSLVIVGLDNTVLNVALPTLRTELDATSSSLQWIVDSYIIVFAGLLLTAGALGDRFGRRKALQAGLVVIGIGSAAAAFSDSTGQLIAARALIGVGAAFAMPATLSIIVEVFPKSERTKAIAIWASVSTLGLMIGPVLGGWMLEQVWWGAIFLIHIPFVVIALMGGWLVVPASRNFNASRLDIRSAVLSISALSSFIYTIIEIPVHGIFDSRVMIAAAIAIVTGIVFVLRQRRISNPLIDVYLFKNRQFSSSVLPISVMSLGIGGVMFLMTQFLQVVLGYGPMEAGLRMFVPIMIGYVIGAGLSPKLEAMFGTRVVVLSGLLIVSVFFTGFVFSTPETSYYFIAAGIVGISLGIGMAMTPATSAVMGAVPGGHAGVGSAMNDATREIGTALGIAVMGSIANSIFGVGMSEVTATLPADVASIASDSVGGAIAVAESLGGVAGESFRTTGIKSFMDALGIAFAVAGLTSAVAAAVVFKFMPKRGETQDA